MSSIRFDGVRFVAYPEDHEPCHVHGFYAEIEVIVELHERPTKEAALGDRTRAVRPGDASRADVKHVLRVATKHFDELVKLWEEAHA